MPLAGQHPLRTDHRGSRVERRRERRRRARSRGSDGSSAAAAPAPARCPPSRAWSPPPTMRTGRPWAAAPASAAAASLKLLRDDGFAHVGAPLRSVIDGRDAGASARARERRRPCRSRCARSRDATSAPSGPHQLQGRDVGDAARCSATCPPTVPSGSGTSSHGPAAEREQGGQRHTRPRPSPRARATASIRRIRVSTTSTPSATGSASAARRWCPRHAPRNGRRWRRRPRRRWPPRSRRQAGSRPAAAARHAEPVRAVGREHCGVRDHVLLAADQSRSRDQFSACLHVGSFPD